MADVTFPTQNRTATINIETQGTLMRPTIRFDLAYVKTIPGLMKLAQMVLAFLGFVCIEAWQVLLDCSISGYFFNFIAWIGICFTGFMLLFYLFHVVEKFSNIPWLKIEFGFCATWTMLYLIASTLAVFCSSAAAGFGFFAMMAYGMDAVIKLISIRNGQR